MKCKKINIGLVARADRGGLAAESLEFFNNMPVSKVLVVDMGSSNLELYPEALVSKAEPDDYMCQHFLDNLDLVFCLETPYNWNLFRFARERGIKTILRINYEWLPDPVKQPPDIYIAPSLWNYNSIPDPKVYLPYPINTDRFTYTPRSKAKVFVHHAGNGNAAWDRNGTQILLAALPFIKKKIKLIIKSQVPIECDDKRVKVIVSDDKNYWDNWPDGDVYIAPRRYAGQSLTLNEAMAKGMAIIMTDIAPQNEFLPKKLLVKPDLVERISVCRPFDIATITPKALAAKIDETAGRDITKYSEASHRIAQAWSWRRLKQRYLQLFENICLPQKTK
jgi:glycosyltransferase involved in cell wall biosynthesis